MTTTKTSITYRVLISTGREYGPKVGWDTDWPTREEAEACAERARQQDGWSARVVEIESESE